MEKMQGEEKKKKKYIEEEKEEEEEEDEEETFSCSFVSCSWFRLLLAFVASSFVVAQARFT